MISTRLAEGVSTEGHWKSYVIIQFSSLTHVFLHEAKAASPVSRPRQPGGSGCLNSASAGDRGVPFFALQILAARLFVPFPFSF
jgi:hypothetical protein